MIEVDDQGEPGSSDTFHVDLTGIDLSADYSAGGTLSGGNIQVR